METTERELMHTGEMIDLIFDVVRKAQGREYDCDKCGRTFLPPGHHHCLSCEHAAIQESLRQCDCGEWLCKGYCADNHFHSGGAEPFQGRF